MSETICIFGASSTWGAYDYENGGWAERLKLYFWNNNEDVDVYNLGVSGDNTKDLLERFEIECKARLPTIIIISIGDNDSTKGSPIYIPINIFEENLRRLIKIAKNFTNKILFLGTKEVDETKTNPVPWDKDVSYDNKTLKEYDIKIKEVAKEQGVEYLQLDGILGKEDFEDGLHPNSEGHEKIFQEVERFLIENWGIKR